MAQATTLSSAREKGTRPEVQESPWDRSGYRPLAYSALYHGRESGGEGDDRRGQTQEYQAEERALQRMRSVLGGSAEAPR